MGTRTRIRHEHYDDLTGRKFNEGEVIDFALDGKQYTIELNKRNAQTLRNTLDKYVRSATLATDEPKVRTPARNVQAARQWALQHGYKVNQRGRLSKEIEEAYDARNDQASTALSGV